MIRILMIFLRGGLKCVAGLAAVLLLYPLAALWSAALPERSHVTAAAPGPVPIALCHDPIHTDFALPVAHVRTALPAIAAHLPQGLPDDTQILIGWGDYKFFTRITTFAEFDAAIAVSAMFGRNPAALRIQWTTQAYVSGACTPLAISEQGRAALDRFMVETLIDGAAPLPPGRYGEVYLPAHGRYSPLHTCNQWTSRALKKSGLPRARFAPFSFSVLWPLEAEEKRKT